MPAHPKYTQHATAHCHAVKKHTLSAYAQSPAHLCSLSHSVTACCCLPCFGKKERAFSSHPALPVHASPKCKPCFHVGQEKAETGWCAGRVAVRNLEGIVGVLLPSPVGVMPGKGDVVCLCYAQEGTRPLHQSQMSHMLPQP